MLERGALSPGTRFDGPAIVEEDGSLTVVWPGWTARVDGYENIVLERS